MRNYVVGGNTKNFGSQSAIRALLANAKNNSEGVDVVYYVPDVYFVAAKKESGLKVGLQDVSEKPESSDTHYAATTSMLKDIECSEVIIGHSDNRKLESDHGKFTLKVKAVTIECPKTRICFCCGESKDERDQGTTNAVLDKHILQLIDASPNWENVVVAYEPVWAIGTGVVALPADAQAACKHIRNFIGSKVGTEIADALRIQYGGSVKADNCVELIQEPDIDGFLVGGACLKAEEFKKIIASCKQ